MSPVDARHGQRVRHRNVQRRVAQDRPGARRPGEHHLPDKGHGASHVQALPLPVHQLLLLPLLPCLSEAVRRAALRRRRHQVRRRPAAGWPPPCTDEVAPPAVAPRHEYARWAGRRGRDGAGQRYRSSTWSRSSRKTWCSEGTPSVATGERAAGPRGAGGKEPGGRPGGGGGQGCQEPAPRSRRRPAPGGVRGPVRASSRSSKASGLFLEFNEIALQYGFVLFFSVALPRRRCSRLPTTSSRWGSARSR